MINKIELSPKNFYAEENEWRMFAYMDSQGRGHGRMYKYADSDTAVLCEGYVKPEHRRQGVINAITKARINDAKKMGAKKIALWVHDDAPEWLKQRYKRMGFEFTGKKTDTGENWMEMVL